MSNMKSLFLTVLVKVKQAKENCVSPSSNNFDLEVGQDQGHSMVTIERTMHAKYQCSIMNTSEDMSQVKVFETDRQTEGRTDIQNKNNVHKLPRA